MKKILLLAIVAVTTLTATAQIETPAASPLSTLDQIVGLTDVKIVYSRPIAS